MMKPPPAGFAYVDARPKNTENSPTSGFQETQVSILCTGTCMYILVQTFGKSTGDFKAKISLGKNPILAVLLEAHTFSIARS
jgi:hypothetical protein